MGLFYQKNIDEFTKLAIWKIEEDEQFFMEKVPLHRTVTHPHKRLQHLAGRYLLQYLFPDFPISLIQIADTKKPFLEDEQYHFSISHCSNYAAVIVSENNRVGIDIEMPQTTALRIQHKFVNEQEYDDLTPQTVADFIQIWSAKEAVFKWYGLGNVDFKKHILLSKNKTNHSSFSCSFVKMQVELNIYLESFESLQLSYIVH
ncbi:MAG: 4'-phosphopantetheinyl transferase superfamily protein [Chitinophagaceae bacterium]|nr:MAG: 4'-phosphopantetheinyl transferase superfamily protein [Chitinophagaceae bacterium]